MLVAFVQRRFMPASLSYWHTEHCDSQGTASRKASLIVYAMCETALTRKVMTELKRRILFGIKRH